jgi:hypothetical protein
MDRGDSEFDWITTLDRYEAIDFLSNHQKASDLVLLIDGKEYCTDVEYESDGQDKISIERDAVFLAATVLCERREEEAEQAKIEAARQLKIAEEEEARRDKIKRDLAKEEKDKSEFERLKKKIGEN